MHLGFTGTRSGLTPPQRLMVQALVAMLRPERCHHGDCIGADAEFHAICRELGLTIVLHPPIDSTRRAFCEGDSAFEPKSFLNRNRDIVDCSDRLIVAPRTFEEQRRSGTWATYRYAQAAKLPCFIVYPNGRYGVPPSKEPTPHAS